MTVAHTNRIENAPDTNIKHKEVCQKNELHYKSNDLNLSAIINLNNFIFVLKCMIQTGLPIFLVHHSSAKNA